MVHYEHLLAAARKNPPAHGDIICIGSSHMELWKTASEDLAPLTLYNYGIGGSRMDQAADFFIDNLAIAFKPRAVILYEGSNDIADGAKPEDVLANFQRLRRKLHAALPETRLYVLGLVPSPGKRFEKIGDIRKTDELLRKECETQPWMKFIDTTTPLIGPDGQPKAECFIPGDIHMLPAGYAIWKSVLSPVVVPAEKPFEKDR
jgi:lysophospholipase L1-like esterase